MKLKIASLERNLFPAWAKGFSMVLLGVPAAARAHAFGAVYTLPLPLWLYLYGCIAALVVSFAVAIFVGRYGREADKVCGPDPGRRNNGRWGGSYSCAALKGTGVAVLLFSIVCALWGSQVASANLSMTLFWVIFILGFQYFCALFGNVYGGANPWRTLAAAVRAPEVNHGIPRRFDAMGYYAAYVFMYGLICFELFGSGSPRDLGIVLLAYSVANLAGAFVLGAKRWFGSFELFGVFFNIVGSLSLLRPAGRRLEIVGPTQVPCANGGLLHAPPAGLTLCIIFLLSSTAFDGFRDTRVFVNIYWVYFYGALTPWVGPDIVKSFPLLQMGFHALQYVALFLSPLPFAVILWLACWAGKAMLRSPISSLVLVRAFSPAIIPVAVGYNVAHYFTLLFSQGVHIVRLVSDPFGNGWDIFGTASYHPSMVLSAEWIWHVQVAAILAGHVLGILHAHRIALRIFGAGRMAALSQLPTLAVMLVYTVTGLWILSAPFAGGGAAIVR